MHAPHVAPAGPTPAPPAAPAKPVMAAPPRPPAPAGRPGVKIDEGGNGLRILTYLRLHWLMIVFCGTLIGAAGAFAAWELLASKYESYALFHVSSVPATVANAGNREQARTDFVTYVKTLSAQIKSEFVLNAALRDLKDVPTIKAQKDPIRFLEEELIVNWQDGSEVVRITCKCAEAADAKKIVDAVQTAVMKEIVQREVLDRQKFRQSVEDAKEEILKIIGRKVDIGKDKPVSKGVTPAAPGGVVPPKELPDLAPPAPPAPGAAGGAAVPPSPIPVVQAGGWDRVTQMDPRILVNRVASLMSEYERLPLAINDGKRRLALLQQKMDAIKDAPISQITLEAVERDIEVATQALRVNKARGDYEFRKNAGDPNAPGVLQLKEAWGIHEAKLQQMKKEKADTFERVNRVNAAKQIAAEMEELIRGLQRQQEQHDVVKVLLSRAEKQLAELPLPGEKGGGNGLMQMDGRGMPAPYDPAASDLTQTDAIYGGLVRQYYLTQMELNSPPRVRELQKGSNPTQKEMKKQIMGTVFAGLMGFGVMILGVLAFETMAKRISSLADVKSATPTPIVGVIPCLPAEAIGKDPAKRNAANEAIDKLRTHVAQTWLARGATSVAVTSPLGDEGKAFAAFGLASSLAQSGYKTLLVDFDLRDPQLHDLAGVPNGAGVCELLRAETDPRTALQFLPSGLHLLTAGKWSDEARKAATGERLESLLSKLKGPYDCVVMHGHALLTAAESVEVARRCEVVLVCALYRTTTAPLLKKAAERVAAMEIPYSGVVYVGATEQEAIC